MLEVAFIHPVTDRQAESQNTVGYYKVDIVLLLIPSLFRDVPKTEQIWRPRDKEGSVCLGTAYGR